jgi:hypothetical protein
MKTKLSAVFAVFASIGLATALSATERPEWKFTEIQPVAGIAGAGSDAGGMSSTTGEELTGASLYFVAHIERPDGSIDPAYGTNPRGVLFFRRVAAAMWCAVLRFRTANSLLHSETEHEKQLRPSRHGDGGRSHSPVSARPRLKVQLSGEAKDSCLEIRITPARSE